MTTFKKSLQFLRSLTSLMIIVIFLVLGSCPVRNALCALVNHAPPNIEQKPTDDLKIIAHDICMEFGFNKITPLHKLTSSSKALVLIAVLVTAFFVSIGLLTNGNVLHPKLATAFLNTIPTYLRNRVLLI